MLSFVKQLAFVVHALNHLCSIFLFGVYAGLVFSTCLKIQNGSHFEESSLLDAHSRCGFEALGAPSCCFAERLEKNKDG